MQLDGAVTWHCFRPTGNNVGEGFATMLTGLGDNASPRMETKAISVAPVEPCSKLCRLPPPYGIESDVINLPELTVPATPLPVYSDYGQQLFIHQHDDNLEAPTALCVIHNVVTEGGKEIHGPPLPFWIDPTTSQLYRQVTPETRASLCGQDIVTTISCQGADTSTVRVELRRQLHADISHIIGLEVRAYMHAINTQLQAAEDRVEALARRLERRYNDMDAMLLNTQVTLQQREIIAEQRALDVQQRALDAQHVELLAEQACIHAEWLALDEIKLEHSHAHSRASRDADQRRRSQSKGCAPRRRRL
ncbi:hypothetical protein JKP88DRAFT_332231 [Tribonema minus]|uniref:Uncharacterized protein n=1 Tax=Tribonema minus TaxID=303371 RepID=A0A835YPG3_9STRA|nr:hypothetical protein JKP88DRAFT_332231 [Tribonema minus]